LTVVLPLLAVAAIVVTPVAAGADIGQSSPTSGTVDMAGSATFSTTLQPTSGSFNGTVTYTQTSTAQTVGLTVTNGVISTTGTLPAATYTISGTDTDTGNVDSGSWTYSLTVTNTVAQGSPLTGTVDVATSANFMATLAPAPGDPGPVTYTQTSTAQTVGLTVTSQGVISTTGTLPAATYTVSGTDADAGSVDTGNWTYSLTVTPDLIIQGSPTSGTTTTANSGDFSTTLSAASGNQGVVTFVSSTSGFTISSGDELVSSNTLSVSGSPYTISGTDSDLDGDAGTWTYTLTVVPTGSKTTIVQLTPTTGAVVNTASSTFTAGPITTENNTGSVTFLTTKSSPSLTVSSSGLISTTGSLAIGTYTVSGTDTDPAGDSGVWTYTLTVAGVEVTVRFEANGGTGVMAPETESEPTALSLNAFKWVGHTFVNWNTSANGAGVAYANGAVFPFSATTTLFAQWKSGKAPSRTVTFFANGGTGSTPSEIDNTPTAISANGFTRAGYTFVDWNTSATGSGRRYDAGETYSFTKSITLYAQWKRIPAHQFHIVTFSANRGTGTMAPERHNSPSSLSLARVTRTGYTFVDWNTAPNGSGVTYANGATYPFSASTTLYAQWKKDKSVATPPIQKTALTIGPFAMGSSTVSSGLQTLIHNVAELVKTNGNSQISLLGYGDTLSVTNERNKSLVAANVELGQKRAQAVATYLQESLNALGLKGWTISLAASDSTTSPSGRSAAGFVVVSLS
jgi:uncharacterized repeat protein (TIGR02543 family)